MMYTVTTLCSSRLHQFRQCQAPEYTHKEGQLHHRMTMDSLEAVTEKRTLAKLDNIMNNFGHPEVLQGVHLATGSFHSMLKVLLGIIPACSHQTPLRLLQICQSPPSVLTQQARKYCVLLWSKSGAICSN